MTSITISTLQEQHIPTCATIIAETPLFQEYGHTPQTALRSMTQALEAQRQGQAKVYTALIEDRCLGFAWFVRKGGFARSGYLRLIAVDASSRNDGVGRALLQHIEAQHLTEGGLFVLCSAHNARGRRFYERLGYQQVGMLPNYVKAGLHEVIYYKASM